MIGDTRKINDAQDTVGRFDGDMALDWTREATSVTSTLAEQQCVRSRGWCAVTNAVDRALTFQNRNGLDGALNGTEFARRVTELRQVTA